MWRLVPPVAKIRKPISARERAWWNTMPVLPWSVSTWTCLDLSIYLPKVINMFLVWLTNLQNGWNVSLYQISLRKKKAISAIDEFFCRFGMPLSIHTDQGSNFVGNVFRSVCELLEIRKTQMTPYHPESNGQIERYNRTIVEMVPCLKLKSEKDWDIYLPYITSAIRCLENPSTGFTANKLMLGREVHKPVHIHFDLMLANMLRN